MTDPNSRSVGRSASAGAPGDYENVNADEPRQRINWPTAVIVAVTATLGAAFVAESYGFAILILPPYPASVVVQEVATLVATGGFILLAAAGTIIAVQYSRVRSRQGRRYEVEEAAAATRVQEALDSLQTELSLANLIRLNRSQMEEYHLITKRQARTSYWAIQIASAVGLVVLVTAAVATIFLGNDTS